MPETTTQLTESEVERMSQRVENNQPLRLYLAEFDLDIDALIRDWRALQARAEALISTCGSDNKVGGCGNHISAADGFRCADCLAWFHRDCINKHFEMDAYVKKLRELREQGAIDDWKAEVGRKEAENAALREQLAAAEKALMNCDSVLSYIYHRERSRLPQETQQHLWDTMLEVEKLTRRKP